MSDSRITSPDSENWGLREAFIIIGSTMGLMIFLLILRFSFNICLDICVLDELERAKKAIVDLITKLFPWQRPRTQPPSAQSHDDIELQECASDQERLEALNQILISKTLSLNDIERLRERHQHSDCGIAEEDMSRNDEAILCSICLHGMAEGDSVFEAKCKHIFHHSCIASWISSRGSGCPYCRAQLINETNLHQLFGSSRNR
jgi:hypothetical protein